MRLFLAIDLSDEMKDSLITIQNAVYDRGIRGNFTSPENMHLTLAFIGEYPDPDDVLDALRTVSFTPVPLALDGIGAFGDLWWVGITGTNGLNAVVRRVRRALSKAEIPFDNRRFRPHITLIRKASAPLPAVVVPQTSMVAEAICLYRSDRGRNSMIYTELGRIAASRSYNENDEDGNL